MPLPNATGSPRVPALLALVLLVWTALAAPPVRAGGPSVPSYRLDVLVDYAAASLAVEQTIRFPNQTGATLDRAVFHVPAAAGAAFRLEAAAVDGQPVAPLLDGSVLDLPLPQPLTPGASAEVRLRFTLGLPRTPGRLSAGDRALMLGSWFPTLAVHRGDWDRHQFVEVGDAIVTEVADFDLRLSTSIPLTVASSGRVVEEGGTTIRLEALGVRDFALSLSPSYTISEVQVGQTAVRAYTFGRQRGQRFADAAARFLRWYGKRLGAYPHRTFTVADVELPASYGGLEYPGLIFISSAYAAPASFEASATEALIGHEVAHQWFYGLVGNDQVNDPWLDEAFATYLPYYYYREVAPAAYEAQFGARASASGRAVGSTVYDFPDDGPYFGVVYRQGARFLDELRRTMGDAAFEAALRDLVGTFRDKLASPRAVLDLFQRHTAANLNPLVARYFSYAAFDDPEPARWTVESPDGAWRSEVALFVGAEFPVTRVEIWLDNRLLYAGTENALRLDLSGVEPGEYVLLVKAFDHRSALYERSRRVTVAGS